MIIKMRKKDENSQLKYAHNARSWQRHTCMYLWFEKKTLKTDEKENIYVNYINT